MPHPADPSKQIEYFLETPSGSGPWPTVVLLHGYQPAPSPGAQEFVAQNALAQLAGRGYLAVAISLPGYGTSGGPADFAGPFTQRAVTGVLARLREQKLSAPGKVVIQGTDIGAITAGLIAARDPSVTGVVLIGGVYDLSSYVSGSKGNRARADLLAALIGQTGGSPEALNARSLLQITTRINASVLVLSGAQDPLTEPKQGSALADQIIRNGGDARAVDYPDFGHIIPLQVSNHGTSAFIDGLLKGDR